MLDRSKDFQRLINLFESLKGNKKLMFQPRFCVVTEGRSFEGVLETMEQADLMDKKLFILTHKETKQLLNEKNMPEHFKDIIKQLYENSGEEMFNDFHLFEPTKKTSNFSPEEIQSILNFGRMSGPDLVDYDEDTLTMAQSILYLMEGMGILSFVKALPLSLDVSLSNIAQQKCHGAEYFEHLSEIANELLPVVIHKIKSKKELDNAINSKQDLVILATMLVGKMFESAATLNILIHGECKEESNKDFQSKKEGKIIRFK